MLIVKGRPAEILGSKHASIKANISHIEEQLKGQPQSVDELRKFSDLDLDEMRQKLDKNEITPLQLLRAFQTKALELYHEGNSGICEFIKEAHAQVNDLTISWDPGREKAPLYGIPISVKELVSCAGYDTTYGLIKLCNRPAAEDSVLLKVLKAEGAIPFVLTSTSQMAFSLGGENVVFGDMHNPYSKNHQQGGSSAGEAVLLTKGGSPVGIGNDAAGSIRIPSVFCGLAGLKPCSRRLSDKGQSNLLKDMVVCIKPCMGPMGRKVEHLAQVMRTVLRPIMFELDPIVPPLPFDNYTYLGISKPKLRIGYYTKFSDPRFIKPVPGVRNAVERALNILRSRGHDIVEFDPPEPHQALEIYIRCLTADGGKNMLHVLKNEPLGEQCRGIQTLLRIPDPLRGIADMIVRRTTGQSLSLARMVTRSRSAESVIKLMNTVQDYCDIFRNTWLKAGDLDALVCPVWACPAISKTMPFCYVSAPILFTCLYNILDYPAGTVPVGRISEEDVSAAMTEAEEFGKLGDAYHKNFFETQKGTEKLPVGVQVVGKPFQEELVLRVMREIERDQT
ncbi:unnamed protein product [Calicophoron daubneyi]|uniref:Amidase domain-containing protein n=1 Tax=Calicophoron daubneyi TaxID=300641 RepID=A0AAV2TYA0_CALDB